MIHELKIRPEYFAAVVSGRKTFEIRRFDRDFLPGDILALNEYDAEEQRYTGNSCLVYIDYMISDSAFCKEGYVVMGIKPCVIWKKGQPPIALEQRMDYRVPLATREQDDPWMPAKVTSEQ